MNTDAPEWWKAIWREGWKDVYIPKKLRKKVKLIIDEKTGLPTIVKIKK
jgi:hypothetical protein